MINSLKVQDNLENKRNLSLNSQTLSDIPSDFLIKTRIKYGTDWSASKAILAEYTNKSSVHGIRYIFGIHRPFYERFYWIVFLLISLYFALSLTWRTYLKWLNSPVIIGFDETLIPIYKIPFPTVTICPETKMDIEIFDFNKVSQQIWSEIEEYNKFENLSNITEKELQYFASALEICRSEVIDRFGPYISKDIQHNVISNLLEMALNESVLFAKWNSRTYSASNIFKYVITDEGVCYQFNGLQSTDIYRDAHYISHRDDKKFDFNDYVEDNLEKFSEISGNWSLDDGYINQSFNAYPQRSFSSSITHSLYLFMFINQNNIENTCHNYKKGFKIFLNSPESVPLTTGNYILTGYDKEVLITIIPEYIKTANNLHKIKAEKRQCYFNDERYLRFFKTYSQNNCQTECLTNYTISKCGCAKFWMPKPLNIPTCNSTDFDCYSQAAIELNLILANQTKQKQKNSKLKIMCDCMPACNTLQYNFEISQAFYDFEKYYLSFRDQRLLEGFSFSRFRIYFKENQFTAIKRTEIFGVTTLLANCGGIFGLFMGISGLSIIEFVYFFTMRLYNNFKKRRYIEKKLMKC